MSDWQLIETAPTEEHATFLAYDKGTFLGCDKGVWVVEVVGGSLSPKETGCGCCSTNLYSATHWMPLPEPPEETP